MTFFGRQWELIVKDRSAKEEIINLTVNNPLRFYFSISLSPSMFLSFGTIKIYNLSPKKRNALHYRSFKTGIAKGNNVYLAAGYKRYSNIFSGSIHNCYSVQQGADVVTIMEVGVNIGNITKTYPAVKSASLTNQNQIAQATKTILINAFTVDSVQLVPISANYISNCVKALDSASINALDYALTPNGTIDNVINYLNSKLKIKIFINSQGTIDVISKAKDESPLIDSSAQVLDITTEYGGLIGSPVDYVVGVQFRTYLRTDARTFQKINFKSKFISRTLVVQKITHSGDTMTDEWYTDWDAINKEVLS